LRIAPIKEIAIVASSALNLIPKEMALQNIASARAERERVLISPILDPFALKAAEDNIGIWIDAAERAGANDMEIDRTLSDLTNSQGELQS
jgi:hypothetical protein